MICKLSHRVERAADRGPGGMDNRNHRHLSLNTHCIRIPFQAVSITYFFLSFEVGIAVPFYKLRYRSSMRLRDFLNQDHTAGRWQRKLQFPGSQIPIVFILQHLNCHWFLSLIPPLLICKVNGFEKLFSNHSSVDRVLNEDSFLFGVHNDYRIRRDV